MQPMARRADLAAFLPRAPRRGRARGRRPRAAGPRRRTPGLRREEVALLAGVSVSWYTWLEQGRPINASVDVLDALARALRLDPVERAHLLELAGHPTRQPDRARSQQRARRACSSCCAASSRRRRIALGPTLGPHRVERLVRDAVPADRDAARRGVQPRLAPVRERRRTRR